MLSSPNIITKEQIEERIKQLQSVQRLYICTTPYAIKEKIYMFRDPDTGDTIFAYHPDDKDSEVLLKGFGLKMTLMPRNTTQEKQETTI